jgi:hypothetical protein
MRLPLMCADNSEIASFYRPFKIKRRGVGFERADIMSVKPSVEKNLAETLNIDMCLTSIICE